MCELRRGTQALLVAASLVLAIAALAIWPTTGSGGQARAAQASCGPDDAYRWHATLSSGAKVAPCLSKVNMHLVISGNSGLNPSYTVQKISIPSSDTQLSYADGSTESGLVHLTFESFDVLHNAQLATSNAEGYTLSITPDSAATLGGKGLATDLIVTADSTIAVSVLGVCLTFRADQAASLSWLLNGTSWNGCSMDVNIRFLATQGGPGQTSIALPNTSVGVS